MEILTYLYEKVLPKGLIGLGVLAIFRFLVYLAKNPEIIDKWSGIYYKFIGFWEKSRRQKIISSELDYRVTKIAKRLNNESIGILPFGLRIKWVKKNDDIPDIKVYNNEVILILKDSSNSDQNLVDAVKLFVPKALLPKARNTCDQIVMKHIDNYTIKKMLSLGNYTSAYNYFMVNILDNAIKSGEIKQEDIETLELSDQKGFFSRILLEEFRLLGETFFGTYEEKKYIQDTIDFFNYIKAIVNRKPGDDSTKLLFIGLQIKIGILFVAKKKTLESFYGLDSYIFRIQKDFEAGANRVYVMGHTVIEDEIGFDDEGYAVSVKKIASFKYLDKIEEELLQSKKYFIKLSDKFEIEINGKKKYTKLLIIDKKLELIDFA